VAKGDQLRHYPSLGGTWLRYSPDGLLLIIGGDEFQVLEAAAGKELLRKNNFPRAQTYPRYPVAFSPDGRFLAVPDGSELQLLAFPSLQTVHTFRGHGGSISSVAFAPDGQTLITGSKDSTALVWDVAGVLPVEKEIVSVDKLWAEMRDADRLAAYGAFCRLRQQPEATVALLSKVLRPVSTVPAEQIQKLITDLDSDRFRVRNRATEELEKLGDAAEPALRKALKNNLSLEFRQRVTNLLDRLDSSLEVLRQRWAIRLLECLGTPGARDLLEQLADGAAEAELTRQAQQALARLRTQKNGQSAE
jgi:hypothetical protein